MFKHIKTTTKNNGELNLHTVCPFSHLTNTNIYIVSTYAHCLFTLYCIIILHFSSTLFLQVSLLFMWL